MAVAFVDCGALTINFNVMGIATVTYSIITDTPNLNQIDDTLPLEAGGKTFTGFVTSASMRQIPKTNWYEINVTIISTAK